MTFAQYMEQARRRAYVTLRNHDRELGRMYLNLASQVNEELMRATTDVGRLHLQRVLNNLVAAADKATDNFSSLIDKALLDAAGVHNKSFSDAMAAYWDALERTDLIFDRVKMVSRIPEEAVRLLYARTYNDGLYLSDRIWKVGHLTRQGLSRIVTEGLARGLHYDDPRIAEQVTRFLQPAKLDPKTLRAKKLQTQITRKVKDADGKVVEFTFRQRPVSYDAARLLRTEFMESFRQSADLAAQRNPACVGEEWQLSADHPLIGCDCEDYADHDEGLGSGVFSPGNLPITPHPNCLCTISQVVVSMDVFNGWVDEYMKSGSGKIADWWSQNWMEMAA